MKHAPNMTDGTISRSHLRSCRHVRITSSVRQTTGIKTKHVAHPPKSGMGNAEFSLTAPPRPDCQISPMPSPTYKSP
jgi:hypothetical protein